MLHCSSVIFCFHILENCVILFSFIALVTIPPKCLSQHPSRVIEQTRCPNRVYRWFNVMSTNIWTQTNTSSVTAQEVQHWWQKRIPMWKSSKPRLYELWSFTKCYAKLFLIFSELLQDYESQVWWPIGPVCDKIHSNGQQPNPIQKVSKTVQANCIKNPHILFLASQTMRMRKRKRIGKTQKTWRHSLTSTKCPRRLK